MVSGEERELEIAALQAEPRILGKRPYGSAELEEIVRRYMRLFDALPPVVVYQDRDGGYVLSDGYLRVEAALRLGRQYVRAEVRQGSADRALVNSVETNRTHGQPLTLQEIQRVITDARSSFSDEKIACLLGYTVEMVQEIATLKEW
jgi:hypothetical protein